jgi:hypothetical protein
MQIEHAARLIQSFENSDLTERLFNLELNFKGVNKASARMLCSQENLTSDLLKAAVHIKKLAGQVNVVIHGVAILATLPLILDEDEQIMYLSLGAGNTGRMFDLETNKRVAEFKFINWQGGAEAIRQNSLFKDFYNLVEYQTDKQRYLYVIGTKIPLRFFNSRRAIKSVLSRNNKLEKEFFAKYGGQFQVVSDYYDYYKDKVRLVDISIMHPILAQVKSEPPVVNSLYGSYPSKPELRYGDDRYSKEKVC